QIQSLSALMGRPDDVLLHGVEHPTGRMTSGTGPPRLVQAAPASLVGPILNGVFPIEVVDGRDKPGRDEESFQGERRIDHDALRMA
ncbi:hypothetical protein, partial [Klebsiella aerogenes]|uniref:hypothetical protein n=1 Tax=Klebsiella aerogenes TaxID=548 RepID=UPI0019542B07